MPAPVKATLPVSPSIERKVSALLARMTLAEKVGQLNQIGTSIYGGDLKKMVRKNRPLIKSGGLGSILSIFGAAAINTLQKIAVEESRLGIPLIFGYDVIHGLRTITPIPLAESAGWDPALVEAAAAMAAREARAVGLHWTFAPMVDIARDPRWGRIAEGAGEDTHLGCVLARARVKGFQGQDLAAPDRVAACVKHFAAYGGAEGGRDYNTVSMSEQQFREVYLPPFAAALNAGAATVMTAFHDFNGVPCTGSRFLFTRVLRAELGFAGFVVSDCYAVAEMIAHGFAADRADAGAKAVNAGTDMDMASHIYHEHLTALVKKGMVSRAVIDEAVRRVLRVKFMLGLFENPYADPQREKTVLLCPEHRNLARKAARECMVLLKNRGGLLPLAKKLRRLAVIGPLADNQNDALGCWAFCGDKKDVVTVLTGIRQAVSTSTKVLYTPGSGITDGKTKDRAAAVALARRADAVIMVVGESQIMSGEARCRVSLDLPAAQEELIKAVHATGKPMVVVLMNGRPLSLPWLAENVPAILVAWHPGVECGPAVADILFGDYNPGGKLPVTFPHSVGQVPIHYNHPNTGRPPLDPKRWYTCKYIDGPHTPLYPFGFGLSYTTFVYSNVKVSPVRVKTSGTVTISVVVRNTGKRAGAEVVQLYVRDLVASMVRPVKELKGFEKIFLKPGEKKTVAFALPVRELGFHNERMKYVVEPGEFKMWVGTSSNEGTEGSFTVI
jgi:beta-glucosidase